VQDAAHQDANIIFGTVIDDSLGDEVRVTVIAAGFDAAGAGRKPVVGALGGAAGEKTGAHRIESARAGKLTSTLFEPVDAVSVPVHTNGSTLNIGGEDDDVDVPPFMRR
jgi:cell division protein FtsZ